MRKSHFVLVSKTLNQIPKIFKTKKAVEGHVVTNPDLEYKTFEDVVSAEMFCEKEKHKYYRHVLAAKEREEALLKKQIKQQIKEQKLEEEKASKKEAREKQAMLTSGKTLNQQQIQMTVGTEPYSKYLRSPVFKGFQPSLLLTKKLPDQIYLFFDGCSKGNPGLSGIGYLGIDKTNTHFKQGHRIGHATNNEAEFTAAAWGLLDCFMKQIKRVRVCGDSQLVVYSLQGKMKIHRPNLRPYYEICKELSREFEFIDFNYVPREQNKQADSLCNQSLMY